MKKLKHFLILAFLYNIQILKTKLERKKNIKKYPKILKCVKEVHCIALIWCQIIPFGYSRTFDLAFSEKISLSKISLN